MNHNYIIKLYTYEKCKQNLDISHPKNENKNKNKLNCKQDKSKSFEKQFLIRCFIR